MIEKPRTIDQTLVQERYRSIVVTTVHEKAITSDLLEAFLATASKSGIGIAPAYNAAGTLAILAMATLTQVLLVQVYSTTKERNSAKQLSGRDLLRDKLLENSTLSIYAFNAHYLAIALFLDMQVHITGLVDLQTLTPDNNLREPLTTAQTAFGLDVELYTANFNEVFRDELWEPKRRDQLAQRAWISQVIGGLDSMELSLASVPRIDTSQWHDSVGLMLFSSGRF